MLYVLRILNVFVLTEWIESCVHMDMVRFGYVEKSMDVCAWCACGLGCPNDLAVSSSLEAVVQNVK